MPHAIRIARYAVFLCAPICGLGCGSSNAGPTGGALTGAVDMHCTMNDMQTKTEVGMCVTQLPDASSAAGDAGSSAPEDAGAEAGATEPPMNDCAGLQSGGGDFGPTRCNNESDDDDCKYHVSWSSTPIRRDTDVFFTVTATKLFDGTPATGAETQIEAFLNPTHPTPSVNINSTEGSNGKYQVGPVRFDQAGMWTVRFHLYQQCLDVVENSPHGHAAFYVSVP